MSGRSVPVVPSLIGLGLACCVVAAFLTRPVPLPAHARDTWISAASGVVRRHVALHTYAIDAVSIATVSAAYGHGRFAAGRGEPVRVIGWAFDPISQSAARRFVYRIDGASWREATYHLPRPDVAAALNVPGASDSGFRVDIATARLAPGRHRVDLATVEESGPPNPLPDGLGLTIKNR